MYQKIKSVVQKMDKTMMSAIVAVFIAIAANAQMKIAVLDFKAGVGVGQGDVNGIATIFGTYFFDPQKFTLVERTQIHKVITEQGFQHSPLTTQQGVKIGEILNVQKIVMGDINIVGGQYNVDVRVVDVETGTVNAVDGATWSKNSSYRTLMESMANRLMSKITPVLATEMAEAQRRAEAERLAERERQRRAEEQRLAEQKRAEEQRRIADERAVEQRRIAEQRAVEQKRLEEQRLNSMSVIINGVRWANSNVGGIGTFAFRPEEYGNYYYWRQQTQNPCPQGWRPPTPQEFQSLVNAGNIWTTRNGVNGRLFGSGNNSIFLPAAGNKDYVEIPAASLGSKGYYWSSTQYDSGRAYYLYLSISPPKIETIDKNHGFCVRCVKE